VGAGLGIGLAGENCALSSFSQPTMKGAQMEFMLTESVLEAWSVLGDASHT
jgi:hypothetical protein